mmetsp:Transcript_17010/g.24234  ORF Transcript_17010/g.24234 Transcript_17010/m.24234 type:complete len:220 (-) Transcript_17010:1540-2199(-)
MPLEDAVVEVVNRLLTSRQRYKVMTDESKGDAIAKALFDERFANGIALTSIISQSKKWLRANIFTPAEILKQMDLHGGTLNYQGISVLNDVESAAYKGSKRRFRNRVLCTPACLQRMAKVLEDKGDSICPFKQIKTDFGEGIEFDYAKHTRLVIDAFGLTDTGQERSINVSASIDAAKVTNNISHTSAGLKMSDTGGCDPLKKMRSFMSDGNSLRDLQS